MKPKITAEDAARLILKVADKAGISLDEMLACVDLIAPQDGSCGEEISASGRSMKALLTELSHRRETE